jgi:hypothetical protein
MVDQLSYTLRDLCLVTGIGRNTLLGEIHAKRLKAFRVGTHGQKWVIPRKAAEERLESRLEEGQAAA